MVVIAIEAYGNFETATSKTKVLFWWVEPRNLYFVTVPYNRRSNDPRSIWFIMLYAVSVNIFAFENFIITYCRVFFFRKQYVCSILILYQKKQIFITYLLLDVTVSVNFKITYRGPGFLYTNKMSYKTKKALLNRGYLLISTNILFMLCFYKELNIK